MLFRSSRPENGTRTKSSTNVLLDRTGNGDQSHTPFKQTPSTAGGEVLYDRYLTDVPTPSHSNAVLNDPICSPLSASEVSKTCHEYTGLVGSSVPADYNRLQRDSLKRNPSSSTTGENAAHPQATQIPGEITSGEVQQYALSEHNNRNTSDGNGGGDGGAGDGSVTTGNSNSQSAVFQPPPPVQLLSQTAGKIPIRRHGLNTLAVVPEGPASLYSSAISALSSVPASSLSITSPSNVFVGPTVLERAPVTPRVGKKSGSSVLSSVPKHVVSVRTSALRKCCNSRVRGYALSSPHSHPQRYGGASSTQSHAQWHSSRTASWVRGRYHRTALVRAGGRDR